MMGEKVYGKDFSVPNADLLEIILTINKVIFPFKKERLYSLI